MYKKIKNGSFMNLIWFIIAILPLVLLLVYSSTFIFNKQTNGYKINNLINLKNDLVSNEDGEQYFENNNIKYITELGELNYNSNYLLFNYSTSYSIEPFYLEVYSEELNHKNYYVYIEYEVLTNTGSIQLNYDIWNGVSTENGVLTPNEITKLNGQFLFGGDNLYIDLDTDSIPQGSFDYEFILKIYVSFIDFPIELLKIQNNWFTIFIENTYFDYLNSINQTIQTNGFISNAFLNLATLFGINNVYMSLACYYIEYLLVIILLHLAFDVLYILPNICHKFMEKIGGERD